MPPTPADAAFSSVEATLAELAAQDYIADEGLATSLYLSLRMGKALFLEGEPGVGKTEVAKVLSRALETRLIRLQCYEGLDINHAVYEWNYPRQLLEIQARGAGLGEDGAGAAGAGDIFTEEFLLKRPLLQALDRDHATAPVLLIDELDRADEEFESFLLELLSDFQVTIPEIGTIRAEHRPLVVVTSNRTREIHDALKRRCVYHWIDYPSLEKEIEIVRRRVPGLEESLSRGVVKFVQTLRGQDLYKLPGIAETLDWAAALEHLNASRLDTETVTSTLGLLLKYQDDVDRLKAEAPRVLEEALG